MVDVSIKWWFFTQMVTSGSTGALYIFRQNPCGSQSGMLSLGSSKTCKQVLPTPRTSCSRMVHLKSSMIEPHPDSFVYRTFKWVTSRNPTRNIPFQRISHGIYGLKHVRNPPKKKSINGHFHGISHQFHGISHGFSPFFPHFPTIFPGKSPGFWTVGRPRATSVQVASANFSAQTSSANLVDFLENTLEPGDQTWEKTSGEIWILFIYILSSKILHQHPGIILFHLDKYIYITNNICLYILYIWWMIYG